MSIQFKQLSHTYAANTPFEYAALKNINLEIKEKKITAIIGTTGSGKTTLVQHLNALLLPTDGTVQINETIITAKEKPKKLKQLRKVVGLVFQFAEYQLFEETVEKDLAFGPRNFGCTMEEALAKGKVALQKVKLATSYLHRSPLDLSGGQKRKVAIAGILAINPDILVLDEPTAGLDPQGAKDMMNLFKEINQQDQKTILIVTHNMEHVLDYCDEVVVLKDGEVYYQNDVKSFFNNSSLLADLDIVAPNVIRLKMILEEKGFKFSSGILTMEQLALEISQQVGEVNE